MPRSGPKLATTLRSTGLQANDPGTLGQNNLLLLLTALRIVNALTISTFFQPDEYYQSLEPAWQMAFGSEAGAWITWEWRTQLRSSLHPSIFAAVYRFVSFLASVFEIQPGPTYSEVLLSAPKITQAVSAALCDYFTWKFAERTYGQGNGRAWATLALTLLNPWQWFCSTRTLSNCLEATITISAACSWPWQILTKPPRSAQTSSGNSKNERELHPREGEPPWSLTRLRLSLLLAAFACFLRPTNVLIWLCIALSTLRHATACERLALIREGALCGSAVLAVSSLADRSYYGVWTLPAVRFLYFNVVQSLAAFYGKNRGDYYVTEGLPLLLTTSAPFAAIGLYHALRVSPLPYGRPAAFRKPRGDNDTDHPNATAPSTDSNELLQSPPKEGSAAATQRHCQAILHALAITVVVVIATLSLISHKEVRFLHPILPFLHVLAGAPLAAFLSPAALRPPQTPRPTYEHRTVSNLPGSRIFRVYGLPRGRKLILGALLSLSAVIAFYAANVHQRGVISVLHHLRREHEVEVAHSQEGGHPSRNVTTTVGFLMPCHSTPWRSHLIYPAIHAWALTCEPPLDVPLDERPSYLDEADQFYADPKAWLLSHMAEPEQRVQRGTGVHAEPEGRPWPTYLVFFEQLEGTMKETLAPEKGAPQGTYKGGYRECWREFNTHWHDDWRRKGDVVVWCQK